MAAISGPLSSPAALWKEPMETECDEGKTISSKRKRQVVGTHNGTFHCDEALGCFMIRLTDKFGDADIVRTRDPKVVVSSYTAYRRAELS